MDENRTTPKRLVAPIPEYAQCREMLSSPLQTAVRYTGMRKTAKRRMPSCCYRTRGKVCGSPAVMIRPPDTNTTAARPLCVRHFEIEAKKHRLKTEYDVTRKDHPPKVKTANKKWRGRIEILPLEQIRLNFQLKENLIDETVQGYVSKIQQGELLPPIRARFDGTHFYCEDGFHRIEASRQMGRSEIRAEVRPGTYAEMEAKHGKFIQALKKSLRRSTL
jgi:ParB-like nuclease domain